jgi:hypothetical protein
MNCRAARELFSDCADERLAPAQLQPFREHVSACANCAAELADLRETVSLIGSLEEIEPARDFLAQVNRKIDKGLSARHWWRFVFEPKWIKLPLEAAALLTVVTLALYVYQRTPERFEDRLMLSQNNSESREQRFSELLANRGAPSSAAKSSDASKPAPAPKPETVETAKQTETGSHSSDTIASLSAPSRAGGAAAGSADTQPQHQETTQVAGAIAPYKAPTGTTAPAKIVEVAADDIGAFENRLGAILPDFGAKVAGRHPSDDGLVLAIELPQSREAEFQSALRRESAARSAPAAFDKRQSAKLREETSPKITLPAAPRFMSPEKIPVAEADGPKVTIELRLREKK